MSSIENVPSHSFNQLATEPEKSTGKPETGSGESFGRKGYTMAQLKEAMGEEGYKNFMDQFTYQLVRDVKNQEDRSRKKRKEWQRAQGA